MASTRPPDQISAEVLAELETGTMRFVDSRGRIGWKGIPKLRNYLMDLLLDAKDDLEDI